MAATSPSDELQKPPWFTRVTMAQWRNLDVAFAAVLVVTALTSLFFPTRFGANVPSANVKWILFPLYVVAGVPVAFRRRWPVQVLALTTAVVAIVTMMGQALPPVPFVALPLYSVTTTMSRRQSVVALVAVEVAIGVSIVVSILDGRGGGSLSANVLALVAAWFIADSIRTRRVYLRGLAEQAQERQRVALENEHRAIIEERLEIARELHDVLAHSLSVIAIQSGVGRHVMGDQPDEARKALLAVEGTSRSALEELRRVLGVLRRRDDRDIDRLPAPSLNDIDALLDGVRATGVRIDFVVDGEIPSLPEGLQLSVFRIIQEALTNVVKHAHGAPASVRLFFPEGEVVVEITNDGVANSEAPRLWRGSTGAPKPNGGHGIVGMTERALAFDGSLSAQQLAGGGFRVLAHLSTRGVS